MRKRVAVVGATGIAGQQFLAALADHPWFECVALAGSTRSAGKVYEDALRAPNGQLLWFQSEPIPEQFRTMRVVLGTDLDLDGIDIVFTAVESDAAKEIEPLYAAHKPTISTAGAFRMEPDVPLLIPGVNTEHSALIKRQQEARGWKGFIAPIPNCTVYGLACTLAPLHRAFGVETVIMTSMQAASGAGRVGGVLALDLVDNLLPWVPGDEVKVEREAHKILGTCDGDVVHPADFAVSCTCTRVPVTDGHTESVFVRTVTPCTVEEATAAFRDFAPPLDGQPTAPTRFITVHEDPFRPQPRLDRDADGGMTAHVGRIRPDAAMGGVKYVLLSHNTKAGAAKGAILVAETLIGTGDIP